MSKKFKLYVDTTVPLTTRETFNVQVPDEVLDGPDYSIKHFMQNLVQQIRANPRVRGALIEGATELIDSSDEARLGVEISWIDIPEVTA